jgi:hypothetical protein
MMTLSASFQRRGHAVGVDGDLLALDRHLPAPDRRRSRRGSR